MRKAEDLFLSGCPKRAVQTLSRPRSTTTQDDQLKATLNKLHPSPEQSTPKPPSLPVFHVTPDTVREAITRRMARGSAPAADGWTRELLVPLVTDRVCLEGLTLFVSCLLNGRYNCDNAAVKMLMTSELLAFPKPNDGIRPISIQSALVRLAEHVGLLLVDPAEIDKILHETQYGVGRGTERAFHTVRHWLHGPEGDVAVGLLLVDFANAFNEASRAEALKAAYACHHLKPLWGILDLTLGTPSPSHIFGRDGNIFHTVMSQQGVRQGSVLAPLVFSLLLNPGLQRLKEKGFKGVAYLDDVTVLVTESDIAKAGGIDALTKQVTDCFAGTQLRVNAAKTVLLLRRSYRLRETPKRCRIVMGATRLLGGPIYFPGEEEAAAAFVDGAVEETKAMFTVAAQFENPLLQLAVARLSLEPRVGFLLRIAPPEVCNTGAAAFDAKLKDFTMECLGASTRDKDRLQNSWDLCQLPEGLNIRTATTTAASGAFASSRDCSGEATAAVKRLTDERRQALLARLDENERSTVAANANPLASLWRRPEPWRTPIEASELPSAAAARSALRLCLLTPDETHGHLCFCGAPIHLSADRHALSCHHAHRNAPHLRLQGAMVLFLKECGLAGIAEKTIQSDVRGERCVERGDVEVIVDGRGGAKTFILELMVPSPNAATWRAAVGNVPNTACLKKEAEYAWVRENTNRSVVGIVVDTHGGVGDRTVEFLAHVLQQTMTRREQGPRIEAAIVRLQLAVVKGLFETFEANRHDMARKPPPATPLLPRTTPQSIDAARRQYAATAADV